MSEQRSKQDFKYLRVPDGLPENPEAEHWQWLLEESAGQHLSDLLFQARALVGGSGSTEAVAVALERYDLEFRRIQALRFQRQKEIAAPSTGGTKPPHGPSAELREARDEVKANLELLNLLNSGQLRTSFHGLDTEYTSMAADVRQQAHESVVRYLQVSRGGART